MNIVNLITTQNHNIILFALLYSTRGGPCQHGFMCGCKQWSNDINEGSGYGYRTVPGVRWTIDNEGGHVVDSVSRIRTVMDMEPYAAIAWTIMNMEMYS